MAEKIMDIAPVQVSPEEMSEIKRLAGDERFSLWHTVYVTVKSGYEGQEALDRINAEHGGQLTYPQYKAILRAFRERSRQLKYSKDESPAPLAGRLYNLVGELLDGVTAEKIKKASLSDIAKATGIFIDKHRILEGKASTIIGVTQSQGDKALLKSQDELKQLKSDMAELMELAAQHGIKLPDEKYFMEKLKEDGEIKEMEKIPSTEEMDSAIENETLDG